jgi:hypothetical protein
MYVFYLKKKGAQRCNLSVSKKEGSGGVEFEEIEKFTWRG